jgi:glutamate dehydrogenase
MNQPAEARGFLQRSLQEIAARQKVSSLLAAHLDHYFDDAEIDETSEAAENLHAAAIQHFRLGEKRAPGQTAVALYNAEFDRHGWQSPHTSIDIVTEDMPFLVDSVTMLTTRHGFTVHRLLHPLINVRRDAAGVLQESGPRAAGGTVESWMHLEIDRVSDPERLAALRDEILAVLADARAAVEDRAGMAERLTETIAALEARPGALGGEVVAYLRWLLENNFVFLGYAHYLAAANDTDVRREAASGLGILRSAEHPEYGRCLAGIPGSLAELAKDPSPLTLVKADARSTIHRPGHLDYVGIKEYDAAGHIVGERCFVGLYASGAYYGSAQAIPVLRVKTAAVRAACGFAPGSHRDKMLLNVIETYPRDELIEIGVDDLARIARGIVSLLERPRVKVFLRRDDWGRYVTALVYMPRDRFDTRVRQRITALLKESLAAESVDFFVRLTESQLARIHFVARTPAGLTATYDPQAIEAEVARIVRGWDDELQHQLVEHLGEETGNAHFLRYGPALPVAYRESVPPASAVSDIERLALVEAQGGVEVKLNAPFTDDGADQHLKFFHRGRPQPLSAIMPVLENLGLVVLSEQSYTVQRESGALQITDFALRLPQHDTLDGAEIRAAFIEHLQKILADAAENDGFNRLTLLAGLSRRQVIVLRAYARYLKQAGLPFGQGYVESCLARYPEVARRLVALFEARLSPNADEAAAQAAGDALTAALGAVVNADDDRILSALRTVIDATLRTNKWQKGADGNEKEYLSFKLSSRAIPFLPEPRPLYEIFVYSARIEGVHLRGARVARGGLRWSDRMEDFRTEVLGLVKAQMVKNAVIVPLGSKGGFVGKRLPPSSEREVWLAEGIACYKTFIRGLLDLTDNLVQGKVVPPADVRRRDNDDPYLVVAADKGTATFSDIANGIAIEYGFWLGDAFASGGSAGYDHKKMGITAKGAWEAVKRHFRELGRDTQSEEFTVIGVGDMSGDVFGNGMLLSQKIRLLAAFDHRHIFLDPNPDAAKSFAERSRIFALPRSSWEDYDKSLISQGGGIFPRSAKTIPLSPEVRAWLGVEATTLPPNELMHVILKAPADLLYNGGIGTYVKASTQSHGEANDRATDALRVDGNELRVKVIGEGGNLGFTQKGRIEFALAGGHIYTDAIDNSAGVDCSDHEVNIKILLSRLVAAGDMTGKQRDALLAQMTDEVGALVLSDNYQQTEAISLEVAAGRSLLDSHKRLMRAMETRGALNRAIEFLPDDKAIAERAQNGRGLTGPEIAVLLAYTKIVLKEDMLASTLPEDEALNDLLVDYFPRPLVECCGEQLPSHPLKREIVTTQLVNRLVNRMGTTFVQLLADETGAQAAQVAAAWYAASRLLDGERLWHAIEALDLGLPAAEQMAMMAELRQLLTGLTRQALTRLRNGASIASLVAGYGKALAAQVANAEAGKEGADAVRAVLAARGVLVDSFALVDTATCAGREFACAVEARQRLAAELDLDWLAGAIDQLPQGNRWQARARAQLASELDVLRVLLLQLAIADSLPATTDAKAVIEELRANPPQDLAMLSAGLGELKRLFTR